MFKTWIEDETAPVHLWKPEDVTDFLSDKGVDVRICKDETDEYCSMVLRGWDDFVGRISATPLSKNLVVPMVREVELWAKRLAALQSGSLRNYRINGIVKTKVK